MIETTLNNKNVIIVGDRFVRDGEMKNIISAGFCNTGNSISDMHSKVDQTEDWDALSKHPNPKVRLMVADNLEKLDQLRSDTDNDVRRKAIIYHELAS